MTQVTPDVADIAQSINTMIAERRVALDVREEAPLPATTEPTLMHEPGVYFGLPAAEYHLDDALGSTDIKALLVHPSYYWAHSAFNPERLQRTETPAMREGSALHKLILEGPAAFDRAYTAEPQAADFPGCLVTADDLKRRCRELSEGVSGVKAELARRIRLKDPKAILFDDIVATHKAMADRDGLTVIKPDMMAQVRASARYITSNPHLARAFKGGAPEVSVFWEEDGLRLKARFDFLKPRAVVDLKKFSTARGRPVDEGVLMSIAQFRYDLQAAHYLQGYAQLYLLAQDGCVFGNCPLPNGWERQIANPSETLWTWIFHAIDAPLTIGRQITPDSTLLTRATREVAEAKAHYRRCVAEFGRDPWICAEPIIELTDQDLPSWLRETVEETV